MKVLYIGQYSEGTTSKIRADHIYKVLKPENFQIIDTHIPFYNTIGPLRSFGFRFKKGPLIKKINQFVLSELQQRHSNSPHDLIWIDKGIFLTPDTINLLKKNTSILVHFTPDMAFYENKSKKFEKSLELYDYAITTKSAEMNRYEEIISENKIILTTQGYSKKVHFPRVPFYQKENSVAFIGLAEESRFQLIEYLIKNNIHCKVAGMGWGKFAAKHNNNPYFSYFGNGIFGDGYSHFLSSSKFALGLLSKQFPEFHTTRTFEIPACGTALFTERNEETISFFKEDEAIFYSSPHEMLEKIQFFLEQEYKLEQLTKKGLERVHKDGYDYESILRKIFDQVLP